jgi:hyperosmotically inducible protein
MNRLARASWAIAVTFCAGGFIAVVAPQTAARESTVTAQQPAPENTRVSRRDRKAMGPTAADQKNNRSDLATTKKIRQSVIKDKSLSAHAHHVEIVTQDGTVTLKGPVRSDAEKLSIEAKAADVVGKERVVSELVVDPKK